MVIDRLEVADGRTKTMLGILGSIGAEGTILIVLPERNDLVRRAAGNLPNVFVAEPGGFSVVQVLEADQVILVGEAADRVTELVTRGRRATAQSAG